VATKDERSWMSRTFGNFFERRGNVLALLTILSVGTVCLMAAFKTDGKEFYEILKAIAAGAAGAYLGSKVKE
jgi:hypothetical protein